MLRLADGLLNVLFYLEIPPDVPPDFHYPLSLKLLSIGKHKNDKNLD